MGDTLNRYHMPLFPREHHVTDPQIESLRDQLRKLQDDVSAIKEAMVPKHSSILTGREVTVAYEELRENGYRMGVR